MAPTTITDATSLEFTHVAVQRVKPEASEMYLTMPFITSERDSLLRLDQCMIYEWWLVELYWWSTWGGTLFIKLNPVLDDLTSPPSLPQPTKGMRGRQMGEEINFYKLLAHARGVYTNATCAMERAYSGARKWRDDATTWHSARTQGVNPQLC